MNDSETKRKAIRDKVEKSRAELEESDHGPSGQPSSDQSRSPVPQRDPPEGVAALAMDYPFALMLGGLAVGVIVGALLPKGAARKLTRGAVAAATAAGELGLTYGRNTLDAAGETAATVTREGRRTLDDLSDKLADLSGTVSENANDASKRALTAASDAAESARDVGLRIAQQVIRLTSQLRH